MIAAGASRNGIHDNIAQCIGGTLVRLRNITQGAAATVAAKIESFNPPAILVRRCFLDDDAPT